jgi:SWI/SNF-related matrix-associated actin-dependent regulator of chromatin subfamily A3
MSAKRRQDAIERFSIPLEDSNADILDESPIPTSRSCSSKTLSRVNSDDEDAASGVDDSDEEFLDDDDDEDCAFVSSTQKKGKGRAKTTKRGKATKHKAAFDRSAFGGENPKVMLLSLKCGSLGLNLTVANNVYL